jgi:superfamily II DNA or RNA helicase
VGYRQRTYQVRAKDSVFDAFEAGIPSTLIVLPTGCGKTIVSAMIIEEYHALTGRRSLFIAHRSTLIDQAVDKFSKYGLDVAVEMATQDSFNHDALFGKSQVVVGSVQTMQKARLARFDPSEFGLVIVDETHHIGAKTHQATIGHFNDRHLLGITATPKPELGEWFRSKAFQYTLHEAINGNGSDDEGGWLVPPVIRKCMITVDLKGLKTTNGADFNVGDIEERLYRVANEIADAIHLKCEGRQTVVFTPDCGSAQALADLIRKKHGRTCEYVAGTGGKFGMSKAERDDKMRRFERGEFQILVNCELLFEGWDCPEVKCVVLCRPCPLHMLYRTIQMIGRGLRPAPDTGYFDCLVLDLDWECDDAARDIACTVDLYGEDQYSDDVMAEARTIERSKKAAAGKDDVLIDAKQILEEAEETIRVRNKLNIKINPEIAKFKTMDVNPVNVSKMIDMKFKSKYDMDSRGNNPASDRQLYALRQLGVDNPEKISKWGAIKLLTELQKRKAAGLATIPQVKALLEKGVDPTIARTMTATSATVSLTELARMEVQAKRVQGSLFQ